MKLRIFNLIFPLMLLFSSVSVFATEPSPPVFAYKSDIILTGDSDYKEVQLSKEIYNLSQNGMNDLRIFDNENGEVPCFILSGNITVSGSNADNKFYGKKIDSFMKDDDEFIDFFITSSPNSDVYGNRLILEIKTTSFAKEIELQGSYDGKLWTYVTSELIYNVGANSDLTMDFNSDIKFPYYRFKIPNNKERIDLTSIILQYTYGSQQVDSSDTFSPKYEIVEESGKTIINIPASELKNIRINTIEILTDSMFQRDVSLPPSFGSHRLCNLTFENLSIVDTTIELDAKIYYGDNDFSITIQNGDDKPINIQGINITYISDLLVFKSEAGKSYTLAFGNETLNAPVYDISSYSNYVIKLDEPIDLCSLSAIETETAQTPPKTSEIDETLIMNIALGVVTVVLIIFILRSVKNNSSKET